MEGRARPPCLPADLVKHDLSENRLPRFAYAVLRFGIMLRRSLDDHDLVGGPAGALHFPVDRDLLAGFQAWIPEHLGQCVGRAVGKRQRLGLGIIGFDRADGVLRRGGEGQSGGGEKGSGCCGTRSLRMAGSPELAGTGLRLGARVDVGRPDTSRRGFEEIDRRRVPARR